MGHVDMGGIPRVNLTASWRALAAAKTSGRGRWETGRNENAPNERTFFHPVPSPASEQGGRKVEQSSALREGQGVGAWLMFIPRRRFDPMSMPPVACEAVLVPGKVAALADP